MEKLKIEKIDGKGVVEMYRLIGKNEDQIASLEFATNEIPESGIIARVNPTPEEYNGNKYFVYDIMDEEGNYLGSMSVGRPHDTFVVKDDIVIVNNGKNKGKAMLRTHRMNDLKRFGRSKADQIAGLVGKRYVAKKIKDKTVLKSYLANDMFVPSNDGNVSAANRKKLGDNTSVKDLYEFNFEEAEAQA